MSILGASVLESTTPGYTGGTSAPLTSLGQDLTAHSAYYGGTGYSDRNDLSFTVKSPKVNAASPGGYTQGRSVLFVKVPRTLANGDKTFDTLRVELAKDSETSAADSLEMRRVIAQILTESSWVPFWDNQSVA